MLAIFTIREFFLQIIYSSGSNVTRANPINLSFFSLFCSFSPTYAYAGVGDITFWLIETHGNYIPKRFKSSIDIVREKTGFFYSIIIALDQYNTISYKQKCFCQLLGQINPKCQTYQVRLVFSSLAQISSILIIKNTLCVDASKSRMKLWLMAACTNEQQKST